MQRKNLVNAGILLVSLYNLLYMIINSFTDNKPLNEAIVIKPIIQTDFIAWLPNQTDYIKNLVLVNNFTAKPNTFCLITNTNGTLEQVLLGLSNKDDFLAFGVLPKILPENTYFVEASGFTSKQLDHAAIGWGLGSYTFVKYKKLPEIKAKLYLSDSYDKFTIKLITENTFLVRDLINIPACDLHPMALAEKAQEVAKEFNADFSLITGEDLRTNFPAIHAVGYGSTQKPILIDLRFGDANAPKIVLVGKGVCLDSGGLQLKGSSHILLMKKDMAGAAHALALARMLMSAKLPINLRVIIPAVENLISGESYKPGDVIMTRKGLSIEITNTDAEGRLILADALALACEWQPELILDFATLTGAARVALGEDIAALFTPDDQMAHDLSKAMALEQEPVWRLPLYQPYLEFFKSHMADLKNASISESPSGGAITAALILQQFITPEVKWAHFDINAYNLKTKPGMPEGGEADCLRGVFSYLKNKYE